MDEPVAIYESTGEPIFNSTHRRTYQASTSIGLRPTQEDRIVVCPRFLRDDGNITICAHACIYSR